MFDEWQRVAVTPEQIDEYALPENPGKESDARAAAFAERHGRLVQVEVEALDPDDLQELVETAVYREWDMSQFERLLADEAEEREQLRTVARSVTQHGS